MSDDHYCKLENLYHNAPCNAYYQPRLHIERGRAELILPVRPNLHHAAGAAHGSVYFKVMDDAAFFAVNSLVEDVFVLTAQFNVHLMRPIREGSMRSVGTVVQASPALYVAEAVVTDDRGKVIGRGTGSFVRSRIALTADIGYALPTD